MVAGQLRRCQSAIAAGVGPGGLFSPPELDGDVVDMHVPYAVEAVLGSGASIADGREDPEPHLRALTALAAMERSVEAHLHHEVLKMRREGVSWAQIAEITGMKSRQAAQKRWGWASK